MQLKLVHELLGSAQAHIPVLGFTIEAIQAGAKQSGVASTSIVADLFSNRRHTARSLLQRFDEQHWQEHAPAHTDRGLRGKAEQPKAYEEAVAILERKLMATIPVRERLPDALAALVTTSLPLVPVSVPDPSPVFRRAYSISDEALQLAGWTGDLSTDWYTTRLSLAKSFMMAELHMISPEQVEEADALSSLQLYRRLSSVSRSQDSSSSTSFPAAEKWASWGSQGWLGIFRSFGL